MSRALILPGFFAYFVRDGVTVDTETVGRETKPDIDPTSNWPRIGEIANADIDLTEQEIEVWQAKPGQVRLQDILLAKSSLDFNLEFDEISKLTFELIFGGAGEITANYTPLGKTAPVKGWLKVQQYDSLNQQVNVFDVFCRIQATNLSTPRDNSALVTFTMNVKVLYSTLNSGTLSNLT